MITVRIDLERCTGYGNCVEAAESVFALDESDRAVVLVEHPTEELWATVRRAARLCPVDAVVIDEDTDDSLPTGRIGVLGDS